MHSIVINYMSYKFVSYFKTKNYKHMRKNIYILIIALGFNLISNAQVESLAGPRVGFVYMTASPATTFLNGDLDIDDLGELPHNYDEIAKGALTSLYGWQWESRFADGDEVTGIVEWIVLIAGMEKGKFLPSISSMVGARTESGLEFAMGPNLSLGGISMVFGAGYNFKSGNLNIPVNIAFVPGRNITQEAYHDWTETQVTIDPDGVPNSGDEYTDWESSSIFVPEFDFHTGNRFSITLGFNMTK